MGIAQLSFNELRGFMTASGTALTNSAAATSLLTAQGKFTIPANWFAVGKKIRIRAWGAVFWTATQVSLTVDVRFGATVVFNGGAILVEQTNVFGTPGKAWKFEADLLCRAVGAAANLMGSGTFASPLVKGAAAGPVGTLVAALPWNAPPAVGNNFDSTALQVVDLFGTWANNTGGVNDSVQCHMFEVELQN
jgi:hypothetical protein